MASITFQPFTTTITVCGSQFTISNAPGDGSLQVSPNTHRGERVSGASNIAGIARHIERIEAEYQERQDRQMRLAQAAQSPEPAIYLTVDRKTDELVFERVGLRGLHKTTGKFLVVRADGSKDSIEKGSILRPLAGVEIAHLNNLHQQEKGILAAAPEGETYRDVVKGYEDFEVSVRFDVAQEKYVTEYDGQTFFVDAYNARQTMTGVITRHLVAKDYPYTIEDSEVQPSSEVERLYFQPVFKTREDAERAVAAAQAAGEVRREFAAVRNSLRFDPTFFAAETS